MGCSEWSGEDCLRALHLTDTHLFPEEDGEFDGVDSFASLKQVVSSAKASHGSADLILVTGDLAQTPVAAAYERLRATLAPLERPVYCIPGNHDDPAVMARALPGGNVRLSRRITARGWQIILLNSRVALRSGGHLAQAELDFLAACLRSAPHSHALVCLHHAPVSVDSPWLDRSALDNPDDLFAVIERHPRVRCILWGHIHQPFDSQRKGVRLLASPSTCAQFKPGAVEHSCEPRAPGYRWLELRPDGSLATGIKRLW